MPHLPKKTKYFIAMVVAVLVIAWVLMLPKRLSSAPNITLDTIKGKTIQLGPSNRHPVLITFWSTSCAVCISEIPHLKKLYSKYRSKGLQVIGINMAYDRPDLVANMVKRMNINYPIVFDAQGAIFEAFKLNRRVTPTSILIAPDNRIVMLRIGRMHMPFVEKTIQNMLMLPIVNGVRHTTVPKTFNNFSLKTKIVDYSD